ncbi:hypothetical protein ANO11243_038230 [Dothideomycetidae sp. 11243]|nr:hypothetical protein ANO11243_038230 [fungal sp. No.11243]
MNLRLHSKNFGSQVELHRRRLSVRFHGCSHGWHSTDDSDTVPFVDPRVFPEQLLGLSYGKALVFRTIAGRPWAVFEELMILSIFSGGLDDVVLTYHTGLASHFKEEYARDELRKRGNPQVENQMASMRILSFQGTPEESLRGDVLRMREQP